MTCHNSYCITFFSWAFCALRNLIKHSVHVYYTCIRLLIRVKLKKLKSASCRRCHAADTTSDTVKPLEMENIMELWTEGDCADAFNAPPEFWRLRFSFHSRRGQCTYGTTGARKKL